MKKKKKVSKRIHKRRMKACASAPTEKQIMERRKHEPEFTLEDIVRAAHKQGMKVDIKLLPKELAPATLEYLRPLLKVPTSEWPGSPGNRSIVAGLDITRKDIEKVFKDNPSSQWVITPFEIVQREAFFAPPVEVTSKGTNTEPPNPS